MNLAAEQWAFVVLIIGYAVLTLCELIAERFWWQWRIAQVEKWLKRASKNAKH